MAADADDADSEQKKKLSEINYNCLYCKKKVQKEDFTCIMCNKICHRSCSARVKDLTILTYKKFLCCAEKEITSETSNCLTMLVTENQNAKGEIKLLKQLIEEMTEKNNLLLEKIHNLEKCAQHVPEPPKTFANIASNTPSPVIKNIPCLIIKPKNKQSVQKTKEDIQRNIKPSELKISVKNMTATKNGNIIIKCSSKPEVETLKCAA